MRMFFEGTKYTVDVSRKGPQLFRLKLGSNSVDVVGRRLNDGGLLIQVCSYPKTLLVFAVSNNGRASQ